jgi:polyferredoxin
MSEKRTQRKHARRWRLAVQVFFFALIAFISVNHSLEVAGKAIPILSSASLHAICPFGGVVSIYQVLTAGTYVKKVHSASFILMWIALALAIAAGPLFCGWVCPLGSVQEWLGKLGKRLFGKRFNRFIPYRFDRILRYLRYGVLGWIVYMTAATGILVFSDWDPYFALFNFWTSEIALSGLAVLGLVVVASLFVERPFCKYACPYGAVLGVFNLFRVFKIRRNPRTCIDCKACDRDCPMNIPVSTSGAVRNHQCISCLKCTSEQACPVARTVELTTVRLEAQV